jgi:hypothetical protein
MDFVGGKKITHIKKYYHNMSFIETHHVLQYTGHWSNYKLLIFFINDLVV